VIGLLRGRLVSREAERLLIDVGGVGYEVRVPASTLLELPQGEVELLVSTQVREESITLYGFLTLDERRAFELLLSVSGVGPRIALAALSSLGHEALATAIAAGDAARLATVPGVGRKTAERLVVDLRDKLAAALSGVRAEGAESIPSGTAGGDVVSALVNLGYPAKQAGKAVKDAEESADGPADFDQLLRLTLQRLSRA
jgi:Holliday junction DNA helicase RuvA